MWLVYALSPLAPFIGSSAMQLSAAPAAFDRTPRLVHGYIDAHWEYPNFLPDDLPHRHALAFHFDEKQWLERYAAPVRKAYADQPDTTLCFRVVGKDYVAPRQPTTMWPIDEQFVFTKVITLQPMKTDAACVERLKRAGA